MWLFGATPYEERNMTAFDPHLSLVPRGPRADDLSI
ncbi:hypothetical protein Gdia_0461 [Gluconacetobacter diazotrophicus PA1 5]|nr:hypothetical protein Gdia_0461 [Gluconacetobacter diazotrophicus PA1 5]TWB07988.1 hypothetical protein FBZ86_1086 [Gluconacetobacter diazotrophicus]